MDETIPLVDLRVQHETIADEIREGWEKVLARASFVFGEEVAAFEDAYARFCAVNHCVAVGNGTDALELALRAIGIGAGDEVVVPANSFIASAAAVVRCGATPVFVDVASDTLLIDCLEVPSRLGPRTRAVMPVHLFGQVAPMAEVNALAEASGVAVVEDAAQAQGATQGGVPAGGFGLAAGTSFYPGKNLGAYGDAGAVLTGSGEVARGVRALRNYGSDVKYEHPVMGFNSRLDTLQCVVLLTKLRHLSAWNAARRAAAARYDRLLKGLVDVTLPVVAPGNEHVFHVYVVRVRERDRVLRHLQEAGISAGVHYPVPIHLQPAFAYLGHGPGDFPVSERAAREILSLPMYPEIRANQQERIVEELSKALC